ncbi:MAG: protein kinase [Gemmatimonadota bacterium]
MTFARLTAALADRYRLERELGAGGMATVYLAHDLRHDRDVAIKVLHPDLGAALGSERFLSEIRTTARLQHPHILPLLDSGEADGLLYYVMPLVTGETLRARLEHDRQLPIADAVLIAREVADALGYAHGLGVIHRDIKPENILLQGGHALVADFGIALAVQSAGGQRMTQTGLSLGTPQYMSPEQAMGERAIDARSDIYALGAVTYEMLVGEAPFTGPSVQAIVARLITEEPRAIGAQRKAVPGNVEGAVLRALEKLPADRFESAKAFADALGNASFARATGTAGAGANPGRGTERARTILRVVLPTAAAVALLTFGLTRWLSAPDGSTGGRSIHVSIPLPGGYELGASDLGPVAISHDGSRIAYVGQKDGKNRIFVRALDQTEARALDGTEGGDGPFFSPDGEWIGFFAGAKLRKIAVSGAALQQLADAPFHRGGDWGDDGFIYYAPTNIGGIWRVPEGGGTPTLVTQLDTAVGEISHRWPHRVAGSKTLLYAAWTGPGDDEHSVAAQTVGALAHVILVKGADAPQYAGPPGLLLYAHRGQLFTVPWRPGESGIGKAVPATALERPNDGIGNEGSGNYSVSDDGTLGYITSPGSYNTQRLVWVSRAGAITTVPLPERAFENVALSPDGNRAVLQIREGLTKLWIYDFGRNTLTPIGPGTGSSQSAQWTPNGAQIIYRGTRQGTRNLYRLAVDGSGVEQRLTIKRGVIQTPTSLSSDGRILLYEEVGPTEPEGTGIWVLRLDTDSAPRRLFPLPATGRDGQLSPDGRWVAFQANVASRKEIFVAPFSGEGERRLVSTDGGIEPLWSHDGRELFYQNGDKLMGVAVTPGATFSAGAPRVLHDGRFFRTITGNTSFSITKDGNRFLRIQPVDPFPSITHIELVLNWFAELDRQTVSGVK